MLLVVYRAMLTFASVDDTAAQRGMCVFYQLVPSLLPLISLFYQSSFFLRH